MRRLLVFGISYFVLYFKEEEREVERLKDLFEVTRLVYCELRVVRDLCLFFLEVFGSGFLFIRLGYFLVFYRVFFMYFFFI